MLVVRGWPSPLAPSPVTAQPLVSIGLYFYLEYKPKKIKLHNSNSKLVEKFRVENIWWIWSFNKLVTFLIEFRKDFLWLKELSFLFVLNGQNNNFVLLNWFYNLAKYVMNDGTEKKSAVINHKYRKHLVLYD